MAFTWRTRYKIHVSIKIALQTYFAEFPKGKGSSCKSLTFVGTFSHHLFDLLNCTRTCSLHLCKILILIEAKQLVQQWEFKITWFLLLFFGGMVSPRCSIGFVEMIIVEAE